MMRFDMIDQVSADASTPPERLVLPTITPLMGGSKRPLALVEAMSTDYEDAPAAAMLGTVAGSVRGGTGTAESMMSGDFDHRDPGRGCDRGLGVLHLHRGRPSDARARGAVPGGKPPVDYSSTEGEETGGISDVALVGPTRPPEPWETGFKDTVIAYPGEVTRIRAKFSTAGNYVCAATS